MQITINTPALLFPCISLLLLAYTNRFLAIANLIRGLKTKYTAEHQPHILLQMGLLHKRLILIRNMQAFAISSLFCCVMCMFLFFWNEDKAGQLTFGLSLALMLVSLILSFSEILVSVNALKIELKDVERELDNLN